MSGSEEVYRTELEPAIPGYLRKKRTQPLGAPASFTPVTPSFSARFSPTVTSLPMVYLGIQYKEYTKHAISIIAGFIRDFEALNGPSFWDHARYKDEAGYTNDMLVGYWDHREFYDAWQSGFPEGWWFSAVDPEGEVGVFRECYTPGIEDTETTFSHQYPEGYSKISTRMSGETDTHGYWGSARDRIPRGQVDALEPRGFPIAGYGPGGNGRHSIVQPHDNLCLLRSGQDWTDTDDAERAFYLNEVKPLLDIGMQEIRDDGASKGCIFNRYVHLLSDSVLQPKTYSLSAWQSLSDIEAWCKAETHLDIFRAGTKHYQTAGKDAKLRLYHEMSVIRAEDQSFEYFNCHRKTGMLNATSVK